MTNETARKFAETIAELRGRERQDSVACAVIETGGLYPHATPPNSLVEIQLHGVFATGMGEDEAIDNWIAKARPTPAETTGVE
ncbi:hypothetical protein [Leisingera daeponensis]|uniref:hypothetical protein n=1 Tax=Leisingera daeponensis TaxID=405746 RepID=UPI001C95B0CB|nr:hypothetical protein [Leisingera daeponensis]MBY6056791.1 hypothetical protein [Leisingera daeponensis]